MAGAEDDGFLYSQVRLLCFLRCFLASASKHLLSYPLELFSVCQLYGGQLPAAAPLPVAQQPPSQRPPDPGEAPRLPKRLPTSIFIRTMIDAMYASYTVLNFA